MKLNRFRAYYLHDERSEDTLLGIEYPKNLGGMGFTAIDSDDAENPEKVRQALKKKGAKLIGAKAKQIGVINKLLDSVEPGTRQLAMKPGFRGDGFVLGQTMIGTARDKYVWHSPSSKPDVGQQGGSLEGWKASVAPVVAQSSFAMLAVFTALAAPLATYVNHHLTDTSGLGPLLSETAILNFSGGSGTGKTTLSRVAAGVFGSPDAIFKWDFTRPGLEGAAESRNDLTLILDDIEKHVEIAMSLKNALRLVGQVVPSGVSKALSPGATTNGCPERRWTTIGISSSPLPLDEIAGNIRWSRSDGEKVRFIDVPVPKATQAGIFDRLPEGTKDRVAVGKAVITKLERNVALHFGHVLPAWITYLLAKNRALKIQKYAATFVNKVAADGTGYDKRYAEKFAILYAAGKLAIEAGILPWPKDLPWKAVSKCYKLALRSAASADVRATGKIELLQGMLNQTARFPKVKSTGEKVIIFGADTLGVRTRIKGRRVCGLRDENLKAFAGSAVIAKAMRKQLAAAGALNAGQGNAGTSQPGIKVKIGGKVSKPRFWIIDESKLAAIS